MAQHVGLSLQDEDGAILQTTSINLGPFLAQMAAADSFTERYPLLSGIDPYGDTTFNGIQTSRLIKELRRASGEPCAKNFDSVIAASCDTLKEVGKEPHVYARFSGD